MVCSTTGIHRPGGYSQELYIYVMMYNRPSSLLSTYRNCSESTNISPSHSSHTTPPPHTSSSLQVYCDMHTDGGGWSLVWKHSYMEVTNFTANMFYNSSFPKPCTNLASGWCNVPSKHRFQPEEMMIVAYHYSTMVYAYKGTFNRNLDHDWTGATLLGNVRAIIDHCTMPRNGVPTPRQENDLAGMVFDKQINSDSETIYGTRSTYYDRRWLECHLPLSISSSKYYVQMTMAIYVR